MGHSFLVSTLGSLTWGRVRTKLPGARCGVVYVFYVAEGEVWRGYVLISSLLVLTVTDQPCYDLKHL